MSYTEFDYWLIEKYIPDYICDEIIKNHNDFIDSELYDGSVVGDYRKSGVCWIKEPFYLNLLRQELWKILFYQLNFDLFLK